MNFLKTLLGWATGAWSAIAGGAADIGKAFTNVWHYVTSVHNLLSWITGNPIRGYVRAALEYMTGVGLALAAIRDVLHRLGAWIWANEVRPVRDQLTRMINALRAWAARRLWLLYVLVIAKYRASLAYTRRLVTLERNQRIKAVQAEHAAMLKAVRAALAAVQQEASSGYNTGIHDRLGTVTGLLDQLATRNPVVKDTVTLLVKGVIDLETVDDPLARWVLAKALTQVIDKAGVDKVIGELASTLLGPLMGQPKARNLYDVCRDVSARLNALERWQADFMANGGPEVEQAGREWKTLTNIGADVALLGMLGLAVNAPAAWATGAADTIGIAGNDALTGIVDLIKRV